MLIMNVYILSIQLNILILIYIKLVVLKNIRNRLKNYPKDSKLLYMFSCNNSKLVET